MYFTESNCSRDEVEIAVVEWEIELEVQVLCLLGEQHVVSGGVIAVEAVVNAVAVVCCWLENDGWWADCMADANDGKAIVNARHVSRCACWLEKGR